MAEQYLICEQLRDLIYSLHALGETDWSQIIRTADDKWSGSTSRLNAKSASDGSFEHLCRQYGWSASLSPRRPKGETHNLCDILWGLWRYRDPLKHQSPQRTIAEQQAAPAYDFADQQVQYLLGAHSEQKAQQLLDSLTNSLTDGLRAKQVSLNSDTPYQFFWLVTNGRPTASALRAADRAWWGPIRHGPSALYTAIFMQWPYYLDLPMPILQWLVRDAEKNDLVLLGRTEPHIMSVHLAPEAPVTQELIEVAELRTQRNTRIEVNAPQKAAVEFDVDLKLVSENARQQLLTRSRELKAEITLKQKVLETVQSRLQDAEYVADQPREPLYLYPGLKGQLPFALQRLLIEWSDQPESLRALRYVRLRLDRDAESSVLARVIGSPEVHVLTTDAALGDAPAGGAGLALREYRPHGALVCFDLLPIWAAWGLHLFVPSGRFLRLYPRFHPTQLAAQKLAHALQVPLSATNDGASGPQNQAGVLLFQSDMEGHLTACRFPLSAMRPLTESFEWNCAVDVVPHVADVAEHHASAAGAAVLNAVGRSLVQNVQQHGRERLRLRRKGLSDRLKIQSRQAEHRDKAIGQLENLSKQFNGQLSSIQQLLDDLDGQRDGVTAAIQQTKLDVTQIRGLNQRLVTLSEQMTQLQERLAALGQKRKDCARQVQELLGG